MDPAAAFGFGDALHAVNSAFPSEAAVDVLAADREDDFLIASKLGGVGVDFLDLPVHGFGVVGVHSIEVGSKEGSFLAARAGTDFHDDVLALKRIRRNQEHLAAFFALFDLLLQGWNLLLGHGGDFLVVLMGEGFVVGKVFSEGLEVGELLDNRNQMAALKHEVLVQTHVLHDIGIRKPLVQLLELLLEIG